MRAIFKKVEKYRAANCQTVLTSILFIPGPIAASN